MKFILEHKLPACTVDKQTVLQLESYMIEQGKEVFGMPPELGNHGLAVTIEETVGTAELSSVSELIGERFPDAIKGIRLYLARWSRGGCDLEIRLNRDGSLSRLKVNSDGPQSRERAVGFMDGVLRILEPRRSTAWLFHPHPLLGGAIYGLTLVSLGSIPLMIDRGSPLHLPGLLLLACLAIFHVGAFLNPYTAFSSRQTENRQRWWQWFVAGSAAFVLFGTLFVIFRKRLIGF
jgi:hypothetical protein